MNKEKNPFVSYTIEEIFASEATTYVIQVGADLFGVKGRRIFTKVSAVRYYNKILKELCDQLKNGDAAQKENAKRVLADLKVLPLRVH